MGWECLKASIHSVLGSGGSGMCGGTKRQAGVGIRCPGSVHARYGQVPDEGLDALVCAEVLW